MKGFSLLHIFIFYEGKRENKIEFLGQVCRERQPHKMEQARTMVKNLTPYERTCLIQEFLGEYPLTARIYCCAGCSLLGGEDAGKGIVPIDLWPCDRCEKAYCKICDPDLLKEELCEKCRELCPSPDLFAPTF